MISVRYSSIPPYLHKSAFYRSLSKEEVDSDIQIPSECYKAGDSVGNVSELSQMLQVERFWALDELPWALMEFCFRLHEHEWKREELEQFPALADMWWFFTERRPLIEAMTCNSRFDIFLFLVGVSSLDDVSATRTAARLGRLDYLKALHEHRYRWDEETCNAAAEGGYLDCLMYAKNNSCPWNSFTLRSAAANGHLQCIKYAVENGLQWHPDVCEAAAKNGHLDCLQYAFNNGCPWTEDVTLEAAENGHADCLRFALEKECPIYSYIFIRGATSGNLECFKLLHQYNAPWDENVTKNAAAGGHLQCLVYLHENGCPWDATTTHYAAAFGYVDCLRYAISNGCDYGEDILLHATQSRNHACLEYLIGELGLYMNEDGSLFLRAMQCGTFLCLQYLIDIGCPIGDLARGSGELHGFGSDNIQKISCRLAARDEQQWQCLEYAARHGWCWNDVVVEYVHQNREDLPTCWAFINDHGDLITS